MILVTRCRCDKAFRFRVEKRFWIINVPILIVLYFFWRWLFDAVSILYLALVSIHALILTLDGNIETAEAAKVLKDEPTELNPREPNA